MSGDAVGPGGSGRFASWLGITAAVAIAAAGFGWTRRRELSVVLLVGYFPAVLVLGTELAIQTAGRA